MKRTNLAILAGFAISLTASGAEENSKWISLFNGKDLSGWTVRGKAV